MTVPESLEFDQVISGEVKVSLCAGPDRFVDIDLEMSSGIFLHCIQNIFSIPGSA